MSSRENEFSRLVESVIQSYQRETETQHIDRGPLPHHAAIIEIIGLLRELLFPGYFGRQNLASKSLNYHVGSLLADIHDKLCRQIQSALRHELQRSPNRTLPAADQSEVIVRDFLSCIPRLRAILATDAQAAFDGDPAASSIGEVIFSYPGFFAITVHRIAHELYLRQIPLIPRIMSEHAHSLTGIDIHPGATIDEYFFIDHGTGIVIGETTHIGKRVKIYQGVTLGALSTRGGQTLRGHKRHPTLLDDVTVYSGSTILGGDTVIGKGAVISGNVFVTKSVPQDTRVTVKNPELQYKDQKPSEFKQEMPNDWVI
ncbi:MAG: serine acetyltransferase [Candidatus Sumerlaeia bacterium]|nr:serine acetyltransferase [Candidatus Sumerlaeia bacterium]